MSDLVEQLHQYGLSICEEAADEIERLKSDCERLQYGVADAIAIFDRLGVVEADDEARRWVILARKELALQAKAAGGGDE